jgi:hypothetical protein
MDARIEVWKRIITMIPSCCNCLNFKNEVCTLYNVTPPAQVIHDGCEQWLDFIPF